MIDRIEELLKNDDAAVGRALDELEACCGDERQCAELAHLRELVDDVEYAAALESLQRLRAMLREAAP